MSNSNTTEQVRSLFDGAASRYDTVVRVTTVEMDVLWKRRLFAAIPDDREYDRILDLACGTGIVTFGLARRYPDAEVVGLDVSFDMLSVAHDRNEYDNVRFVEKPAEKMDDFGRDSFDLVTASYLPKYTDISRLAANTAMILTDRGAAAFHDFTYPRSWLYSTIFDVYWAILKRVLPHVPGYDQISADLRNLIVNASRWPEELQASLERSGLDRASVDWQPLEVAAIVIAYNEVDS